MMVYATRDDTKGFTIVELIIALMVFGVVIAGALGFMTNQNRAFQKGSEQMTALINLQYAMQVLEADVPTLGTNLVANQPGMVFAEDSVIAFNADYATNAADDPFAVYYDPDAPTGQVTSPQATYTIPTTSYNWPTSPFHQTAVGTPAPAELIQLGILPDPETARTDDYRLLRKVNNAPWEIVARHLLKPSGGEPFFKYFIHRAYPAAPTQLDSIPTASLPQTAAGFLADSIRAVRISLRSTNGLSGENERIAEMTRLVTMPNAGMRKLQTCGDGPILGSTVAATPGVDGSGDPIVTVQWTSAVDDGGGENDVMRYVIWRRDVTAGDPFVDPLVSVPAGTGNTYVDAEVQDSTTYQYQLAAQDCTPAFSAGALSPDAVIP